MKSTKYLLFAVIIFAASCKKDDDENSGTYSKGIFVLNQGKFPGGASAVTFINESDNITVDAFDAENGDVLAPVAQGMLINENKIYISLNGGNEVKVVDARTFKTKATINGVNLPRYFVSNGNEILMSQWGSGGFDGSIKIISTNNIFTGEIKTGRAPEKMLITNNKLYVTMSNGFTSDSLLRIYNISTKTLISELTLSAGPNSIVQDNSGNIWVLCGGYYDFNTGKITNARLYKITNDKVVSYIDLDNSGLDNLLTNGAKNKLFFTNGSKISEFNPATNIITDYTIPGVNAFWYGLGYSEKQNALFASDPKDYASQGSVYRLDLDDNKVNEFKASVVPAQIFIKE